MRLCTWWLSTLLQPKKNREKHTKRGSENSHAVAQMAQCAVPWLPIMTHYILCSALNQHETPESFKSCPSDIGRKLPCKASKWMCGISWEMSCHCLLLRVPRKDLFALLAVPKGSRAKGRQRCNSLIRQWATTEYLGNTAQRSLLGLVQHLESVVFN